MTNAGRGRALEAELQDFVPVVLAGRGPGVDTAVILPHIYEGWSVAVMKSGEMVNRWADPSAPWRAREEHVHRFDQTQEWIDESMRADKLAA